MVILKGGPLKGDLITHSMKGLYPAYGIIHLKSTFYIEYDETDLGLKSNSPHGMSCVAHF